MSNDIAGIPFFKAEFGEKGEMKGSAPVLPLDTTDVYVISHGWNNNAKEASDLYTELFTNLTKVAPAALLASRKMAIVGVYWPSKKFDEMVAVETAANSTGGVAAGVGGATAASDPAGDAKLQTKLEDLKQFFTTPAQVLALKEAQALVPQIEINATAREDFVTKIRGLVDESMAEKDDASSNFFAADPADVMERLRIEEEDLELEKSGSKGGAAGTLRKGAAESGTSGGAAGILEFLGGFKNAAMNTLNYTTYYEMKNRAGIVGAKGVAPMLNGFPRQIRIHLVGHSFGARVVTAAAAESKTDSIRSMCLLQAAFSHNGFSQSMKGFFRKVIDEQRVKGPILVTHTKNDKAVGVAYPIASRLAGQVAAALGDENDRFGGLGRNGAQKMNAGEVIKGALLPVGSGDYTFQAGKFFNALADPFIADHGAVTGREVAYAVAVASMGSL